MNTYVFAFGSLLLATTMFGAEPFNSSTLREIRNVWEEPRCEAILRRTYIDINNFIKDSKFSEVVPRIAASTVQVWPHHPNVTPPQLALKRDVVVMNGGPSHILLVDIESKEDGTAYCLKASLQVEFEAAHAPSLSRIAYPEGSLVGEILKTLHFKKQLSKQSCVTSIEISFGKISNSGSLETGMGYTVYIVLRERDRTGKLGNAAGFFYQALSGMDPVKNVTDGKETSSAGERVFRSSVLEGMTAITTSGFSPAIWTLD